MTEKINEELNTFNPDWCSPPGSTILDCLKEKGITLSEFSTLIKKSETFTQKLIIGEERINNDLAIQLSSIIGPTTSFWLHRENKYRIREWTSLLEKLLKNEKNSDADLRTFSDKLTSALMNDDTYNDTNKLVIKYLNDDRVWNSEPVIVFGLILSTMYDIENWQRYLERFKRTYPPEILKPFLKHLNCDGI